MSIVREKSKGKTVDVPTEEKAPDAVPDLMAALEQSLADAKKSRSKAKA